MEIVVRALRDFYLACVAPYWSRIVATFRADVADRIPVLATGGLAEVLGTLHETLAWRDNSLERSWRTGECSLDGHGVQLLPSALWTGPPLFCDHPPEFGGNALIYPARPAATASTRPASPVTWPGSSGTPGPPCCARCAPRAAPRNWRPASAPARRPPRSTPPRCVPPAWCKRYGAAAASTIR